ncbi:MAG: branched-chain amino acid ABC transporter permease [Chloroflexi bacterium]|nr:branched-chain amino acid ABC transporter permease [Chloroflexota bacterium]
MTAQALYARLQSRRRLVAIVLFALLVGTIPLWLNTPYALSTLIFVGIYTIPTIGLCLLMGYAGQISLGQAAFFGLGAYGSAILSGRFGWSPWLAMIASALGTGVIAALIGSPIFRLRSHYLAMGTLAFGAIVHIVFTEWKEYTGGSTGLPGIPRLTIAGMPIKTDLAYYYLVWLFVLLALIIALNIVNSRFGRALRAIRDSEPAAQSLGIDISSYKLQTLVTSALYASVAGSLYAHYMIFVSPAAADLDLSIRLVLMAAVGGLASIWGAPFGTAAVLLLTTALREIVPLITAYGSGEYQIIAYGTLLVVIMIFMPEGLIAGIRRAWQSTGGWERLQRLLRRGR